MASYSDDYHAVKADDSYTSRTGCDEQVENNSSPSYTAPADYDDALDGYDAGPLQHDVLLGGYIPNSEPTNDADGYAGHTAPADQPEPEDEPKATMQFDDKAWNEPAKPKAGKREHGQKTSECSMDTSNGSAEGVCASQLP